MYSFLDGLQCAYNNNKSKYENRMNYKDMTNEEIEYQLEYSDEQEFGTNYAKYLHNMKKQAIQFIKDELVNIVQETLVDTIIYQEKLNKLLEILGDKEIPKGFKSHEDYKKKEEAFINHFCKGDKENE